MFKRLLLVAILFALAAPAMAQQLPDAFVRVTAMCDNPDNTYNLRVRYEVDSNNANKPDSGTVTFNLQVGGTAYVTGETIEPGESKFYDVPDTANGIRAVLSGHNNTYGGTASNNNNPCATTTTSTSTTTSTTSSTTTSTTMATTTTTLATTTTSEDVGSGGESTTSTTAPTTSSTDDVDGGTVDTLPFTGPTDGTGLLAISGVALLALGVASLISVRRQGRHEV